MKSIWIINGAPKSHEIEKEKIALVNTFSSILKLSHEGRAVEGGISLTLPEQGNLKYEDVVRVFGTSWKLDMAPLPDGPLPPTSAQHGNEHLTWQAVTDDVTYHVEIYFNRKGRLSGILARGEI